MKADFVCRDAVDEDSDFLFQLYASTREDEVRGFGWDAAASEAFLRSQFNARERVYKAQFPTATDQIVVVNGFKVGRINVCGNSEALHLIDIAILPEYRNRGLGSTIINSLKSAAAADKLKIFLRVDRSAKTAIKLYRNSGFRITAESQIMFEMEWHPDIGPGEDRVTLTTVTEGDQDLLVRIYEASREIELSMTNWSCDQRRSFAELQLEGQTRHYKEYYPNALHFLIRHNGNTVGRLYVNRGDAEIAILDLTVLPEFRRLGIGTQLIKGLQKEAGELDKSVRVFVETFNPSQKLFAGLGFAVDGQDGVNLKMVWRAKN
ncbi:MAG: GNAT family N-acetyltransferase [Pyrinomonadaceae bacterium]